MSCYCLNSACKVIRHSFMFRRFLLTSHHSSSFRSEPGDPEEAVPSRRRSRPLPELLALLPPGDSSLDQLGDNSPDGSASVLSHPFSEDTSPRSGVSHTQQRMTSWLRDVTLAVPGSNTILSSIILGNLNNAFLIVRYNVFVYVILYIFSWNSRYFNT